MEPKLFSRMSKRIADIMQKNGGRSFQPIPEADINGQVDRLFRLLKYAQIARGIESEVVQKKADMSYRSMVSTIGSLTETLEKTRIAVEHNRKHLSSRKSEVDVAGNLLRSFALMHEAKIKFDWVGADATTKIGAHLEIIVPPFIVEDKKRKIRVPYPQVTIRWFPELGPHKAVKFYFADNIKWLHGYHGQFHAHVYGSKDDGYDTPHGFCSGEAQQWIGGSMPEGRLYDCLVSILDALHDPKLTGSHDPIHDPRLEAFCEKCQAWAKNVVFPKERSPSIAPTCCWLLTPSGVHDKKDLFEYGDQWWPKSEAYVEDGMPTCPKKLVVVIGDKRFHPLKIKKCCITGVQIGLIARGSVPKHYQEGIELPDGRFVSVGCLDIIEEEYAKQAKAPKEKADGQEQGKAVESQAATVGAAGPKDWPMVGGRWSRYVQYKPGAFGHGIGHYDVLARQNTPARRKSAKRNSPVSAGAKRAAGGAPAAKGASGAVKPRRTAAAKIQEKAGAPPAA